MIVALSGRDLGIFRIHCHFFDQQAIQRGP
jgi:hypothetical protein